MRYPRNSASWCRNTIGLSPLDYPLGHTAGKPNNPEEQKTIMRATLAAFEAIDTPGEIVELPLQWRDDDAWKDHVMRPHARGPQERDDAHADDRVARSATPQYQSDADRAAADPACASCVFLEQRP
jgi:hypothetical protein